MMKFLVRLLMACALLIAALALLFAVRQARAAAQIEREWQSPPDAIRTLQPTSRLEIVPLYEEAGDSSRFAVGHGVSYLIRTDAFTLLMDVGNNPDKAAVQPYLSNMRALGITWDEIDAILVTHPHPDHLGGVRAWQARTLALGTDAGVAGARPVYLPSMLTVPGAVPTVVAVPGLIGPDIATTGAIAYLEGYPFYLSDPIGREQALVVSITGRGLVVITGCGHPTLERLVARAEALFGQPVVGVVGGLHYEGESADDVQPHIQFLAARQPQLVALSPHDSSPEALQAFQAAFPEAYRQVQVGQSILFPEPAAGLHGLNDDSPDRFAEVRVYNVLKQTLPVSSSARPAYGVIEATEVAAFLGELLPAQLLQNHIAGAAVAVVKDGQLLFAQGYGAADLAAHTPVIADRTLFRTDSTGKLFVWTAVMQLVEQGTLSLDADINTYLDFRIPDTFRQPITLKHLMAHSAGFDDQGYLSAHALADMQPSGEWLRANIPARVRPPGEVSGYSNYGVGLAGYIVERVSGLPFEQYMEDRIFGPLGMLHSTFRQPVPLDLAADLTTNYRFANDRFNPLPFQYLRIPATGEGHMTVIDMAQFMLAHLQAGDSPILRAVTTQQMHSQLFTNDPRVSGIAYGFVESTQNGLRLLRHEGNLPGVSSTALFLVPEQQLGVYVVFNSNGGFGPGEAFRRAFLDHYFPAQSNRPQPIRLTDAQVQALRGSYRSTRMFSTTFGKVMRLVGGNYADIVISPNSDGTFTTRGLGPDPLQWAAVEPDVLRLANGALNSHGDLVFGTDERGRLTRLYVGNNPYRAFEKVAWYEGVTFHIAWLALAGLVLLLALTALPAGWLLRGGLHAQFAPAPNAVATWLLAGACGLALLFPVGLVLTLPEALVYGVTPAMTAVLALPFAALAFAAGALWLIVPDWNGPSLLVRFQYSVVMAAMMAFAGWLAYWNLLGWKY